MASVPDLLGASAARHGERAAIVMDGRLMTYAGLEAASNRLARSLIRHGVVRGDRVALWLPKSIEAIVALYGVMKTGAAYVPVDPAAPAARLVYVARNCEVAGLVTLADRAPALEEAFGGRAPMRAVWYADAAGGPPLAGLPVVPWSGLEAESAERPATSADEDDPAQIVYTSGSTGEPKGVMIPHRSLLSATESRVDYLGLSPEDRIANHAPFHFSMSAFDLFGSAHAGATLYPISPRIAPFPAAVATLWSEQRITVLYVVPSVLTLALTRGNLAALDLSSLRVVVFGGEVFPAKRLRELMQLAPKARFIHIYGRTETRTCAWYEITSPPEDDAPIPIGQACSYCKLFVLDDFERPVPDGSAGELWVSGPTVMRGYWGLPEVTAQSLKLIEVSPGVRVLACRTGDLVRRREDGNLELLGRRDHQVKTRGYRVDLGEIETALNRHGAIEQAVVVAVPDEEIGCRLKAVVVAKAGAEVDEAGLRRHCSATLPRYMVPETIELRPGLPLTSSGKIDRPALLGAAGGQSTPKVPGVRTDEA